MRSRFNRLAIAVVLAILSFAYARYRYVSGNSATLTNPFNNRQSTRLNSSFMDKDLFGDWTKDQMAFAIIVPVIFLAGGAVWAVRK